MNIPISAERQLHFTPSKSKLVVLRMAAGLDCRGLGPSTRNYIIVPCDSANSMLQVCHRLVKEGMFVEKERQLTSCDTMFVLTDAGMAEARPKGQRRFSITPGAEETETRQEMIDGAVFQLQQAIELTVEARRSTNECMKGYPGFMEEWDDKLSTCLSYIGELCYQLGEVQKNERRRGGATDKVR